MKNLFNFKPTHGGVSGRNQAHSIKIKSFGFVLALMIGAIFTVSAINADFSNVNGKAIAGTSIALAPIFMVGGKFKELTVSDLETFTKDATAEDMAAYFNALNDNKREELKALVDSKASKEDIDKAIEAIKESQTEQMKQLNETLKQYGLAIKKLTEQEKTDKSNQVTDIRKALEANIEKLRALKNGGKGEADASQFTIKAAGTMLESTNISGGNVPVEQRIAGLDVIATRRIRLLDLFTKASATSNIISWVSQANKDGAAGGTTEGATKNQIDFDLVVASQAVVKRTAFIKVSTEMMDDVDFIESEIKNELMRELMKDIELTAYSGTGVAPALNGIRTVSTAFAAGSFALTVDNANQVDVLVVAVNQIMIAEQPMPNYILMHPTDVTKLKLAKVSSTDKRYIDRLQLIGGNLLMDGIPIIPTTLVTVDTYLIGSFDLATMYSKGEISIEIGLDGNDFTKNLRTILAEWRGALVVKTNKRTAFVKGTFSTDMSALETV